MSTEARNIGSTPNSRAGDLGHPLGRPTDSQHTNPTSQGATMPEQSAARSLGPVRRRIRLAMIAVIAVIAGATLLVTAGVARADTFNPWPNSGVKTYPPVFGDCTVTVGPVQDPNGTSSTFFIIGGVTVSCRSRHNLKAIVAEYYAPSGGAWRWVGQQSSTFFPNSYGWDVPRILETSRICGIGGQLPGWWLTRAWVYDTDASGNVSYSSYYFDSIAESATAKAC
jgi:hypothetical protein